MHDDPIIRHFEKSLTVLRRIATGHHHRTPDVGSFSRTQLDILTLIDDKADRTIKDLAKLLAMTSGAITQTVETLVRRDLIRKTQSKRDRRSMQLQLTSAGQTAVNKYYQVRSQMLRVFMEELSEAEIETILKLSKKITSFEIAGSGPKPATEQPTDIPTGQNQ